MKLVGLTMRQDFCVERKESIDLIDNRWYDFLRKCNLTPVLIPNDVYQAKQLVHLNNLVGVILTGGGDPFVISNKKERRDQIESFLLERAIIDGYPLLGVCRGMQVLLGNCGIKFSLTSGHVGTRHKIDWFSYEKEVNSYHNYATKDVTDEFTILARSLSGEIECVRSKDGKRAGIMWHPEREDIFCQHDIDFVSNLFESRDNV